jgi:capsular polysaccharide biosynthesis protein
VDNVSILAQAEFKDNPVPVKPKPILYISIAILVGMFIGSGTALLVELMDNTLKDEQDAAMVLGLPILGSVQKMQKSDKNGVASSLNKQMGSETIVS